HRPPRAPRRAAASASTGAEHNDRIVLIDSSDSGPPPPWRVGRSAGGRSKSEEHCSIRGRRSKPSERSFYLPRCGGAVGTERGAGGRGEGRILPPPIWRRAGARDAADGSPRASARGGEEGPTLPAILAMPLRAKALRLRYAGRAASDQEGCWSESRRRSAPFAAAGQRRHGRHQRTEAGAP